MPIAYINRELSWLEFNQRVLNQAQRPDLPLLDRVKFLAISGSNLDEFFQVRIGGLLSLCELAPGFTDPSGRDVSEQLSAIEKRTRRFAKDQEKLYLKELLPSLHQSGLPHLSIPELSPDQFERLVHTFQHEISPLLSPLLLTPENAREIIPSLSVCIALRVYDPETKESRIIVLPLPSSVPRMLVLNEGGFIFLEDLTAHLCGNLFPGEEVTELTTFRLTRNTDIPANEDEAHDFAEEIRNVITERGQSFPVRLQLSEDNKLTQDLISLLKIDIPKVFLTKAPLALADLFELALIDGFSHLRTAPLSGVDSPKIDPSRSLFDLISEQDLTLIHPYQSYRPIVRFMEEAAIDPNVIAIKQTLYRTAKDSQIVDALIRAAKAGKQVTALVELKARFDEAPNLERAEELRRAGAQVIYGVKGLKTHAKISLVIRREDGHLRRYVHLATGNYNELTARFYTDISYFTARPDFGSDASIFFNAVTGRTKLEHFKVLVPAPTQIKRTLIALIEEETARALEGETAHIMAKMNSLEDIDMIEALYRASKAGVKIQLNIRGICCLKTGERKEAKNIEVVSIVDQQLEHMRIFYFHQGGDNEVFISSADWMSRNLEKRVELMTPIPGAKDKKLLIDILNACFKDNQNACLIQADGTSKPKERKKGERKFRMQEHLADLFARQAAAAEQARSSSLEPHLPKE
ncbi:polyphosphate kinase 1 [Akkermansiaceae bacterium]|nr:polyphosphate kinase 1 [Akkermansiaceae bacterium]MDB4752937.1 polyphosphate kinase 1 [bacterium]